MNISSNEIYIYALHFVYINISLAPIEKYIVGIYIYSVATGMICIRDKKLQKKTII